MIFTPEVTHDMEELGYDTQPLSENGAEVVFTKGDHKIELYHTDDEWFIFSESVRRAKSVDGYSMHEAIGLSNKEIEIINAMIDIVDKEYKKEIINGG